MPAQIFLNKQPILDAQQKLYGYHLSLELAGQNEQTAVDWDGVMKAFCDRVAEHEGMKSLVAEKPAFFSAPVEVLKEKWLPQMDNLADLCVEVDMSIINNKAALNELKEIIKAGAKISVLGYENSEAYKKLLGLAKFVKIDSKEFSPEEAKTVISALKMQQKPTIITGIETEEDFLAYQAVRADFYQGYFFTTPVISGQKELSGSRLAMLKLLADVNDPDVEFEKIVSTVGSDVGLTHKLLSAINHPSNNIPHVIETLKDAVNFMGLKRLKFWVNMMMLSEVDDVPKELLATALVRAKFMEDLAEKQGKPEQKDRYFMAGMFSTLNAFLKASMVDIVGQLPLSNEVKIALVDNSGEMGKALFVIRSLEQGNSSVLGNGMDIMQVSSAFMNANSWARKTLMGLEAA